MALTSKKEEVSSFPLLVKKISLLKVLSFSKCLITDRGADMVVAIIPTAVSLQEIDVSHTKLTTQNAIKIAEASKKISSLKILQMHENTIGEEAAESIAAATDRNNLIEKLNLSFNMFCSIGLTKILNALSIKSHVRILDISGNNLSGIDVMATSFTKCHTLQVLNVSHCCLMFAEIVRIAESLRGHWNLEILNMECNITSFFSECEVLVDIILSTSQSLMELNVCGRNIRPRFTTEQLIPVCIHAQFRDFNFQIQSLYLSHYLPLSCILVNKCTEFSSVHSEAIKTTESCPIINSNDIVSYFVDYDGCTLYNDSHNFVIVVPPGAVLQGECVEIQATASLFGPYQLPHGYIPISSFFWVSANYTFKKPVYLIFSHHANFTSIDDIYNCCALEACAHDLCVTSDGKLMMNKVLGGTFFDCKIGFCIISTNHFCSYCLAKSDKVVLPDKFYASFYTHVDRGILKAEICMCHVNKDCIEVCLLLKVVDRSFDFC